MKLIGNVEELTTFDRNVRPKYDLFIPLQFWFCRNNGLALPIIALEYHDIEISIKFKEIYQCSYFENLGEDREININDLFENNQYNLHAELLIDFIYLGGAERKKFAQGSHEYLIEQVQTNFFEEIDQEDYQLKLDLYNPTKEIIWVMQKNVYINNDSGFKKCMWNNYGINKNGNGNPLNNARLEFNGHERIAKYDGLYFNFLQPYSHHRNTPCDGINMYSFCFTPEEHQPSGTCNFSRISNPMFYLSINNKMFTYNKSDLYHDAIEDDEILYTSISLKIYAVNYNILRIISGMAGLAYTK